AIKGGIKSKHLDCLKITLVTENEHGRKYRAKVDLYEDTAVNKYLKAASEKLGLREDLLDLDIALLTDHLEQYREENTLSLSIEKEKTFSISGVEKSAALQFLKQPNLLEKLNKKIGKSGIVGEENNRLLPLIGASSDKQENPLHALLQGSRGSGKPLLLRKVMYFLPDPIRHIWTRITDKSLYHAGSKYKHHAIAVEDWDGISEDTQYVIRELQTGGGLASSTTEKQSDGTMTAKEIFTEGPISSLMCTTKGSVYEDNMSRCFLVAVDESEQQTDKILDYQYQKDRGDLNKEQEEQATRFIQVLIELLEPCKVVNPYAGKVKLPKSVHKIRRLNNLYQVFVQQITWLHQYQR
ncbi:MAG: hypothetical protein GY810_26810, partial [Aureispira sp.]|nr:hypothetical protein [Aureispira sp.]